MPEESPALTLAAAGIAIGGALRQWARSEGHKRWRYAAQPCVAWPPSGAQLDADGNPVWMLPWIADGGWTALRRPEPSELSEVVLGHGDVLCVPAGCWHAASAVGGDSLALNLSFGAVSFVDLLRTLLTQSFDSDLQWRGGPPPLAAGHGASEEVPDTVRRYLAERLRDLTDFVGALDPAGPELAALWREAAGA